MTIDSHIHFFPPAIAANPVVWAEARGEQHWAAVVAKDFPHGLQSWPTETELLAALDGAEIDTAILLGWYWEQQETCEEQLAWYLDIKQRHPERFLVFAPIQPRAGAAVLDYAKRALDAGVSGFGEMLPAAQDFDINEDPVWHQLCELCAERGVPINLHVTEAAGHDYTGRVETPLMDYVRLAQRHPETTFILAHWGGGLPFYELNPKVRRALRNVFYDTAASPLLYDSRIWHMVTEVIGPERILFGSDYPLRVYPKRQETASIVPLLEESRASGLSATSVEKILGGNARSLFGL
ncbi:MAG: amidohydrolase family protein [Verrucomicrobiota bacterium]|nr:amidohydrolase family protein [Verrucomicrobiota bacterium]